MGFPETIFIFEKIPKSLSKENKRESKEKIRAVRIECVFVFKNGEEAQQNGK